MLSARALRCRHRSVKVRNSAAQNQSRHRYKRINSPRKRRHSAMPLDAQLFSAAKEKPVQTSAPACSIESGFAHSALLLRNQQRDTPVLRAPLFRSIVANRILFAVTLRLKPRRIDARRNQTHPLHSWPAHRRAPGLQPHRPYCPYSRQSLRGHSDTPSGSQQYCPTAPAKKAAA